MKKSKLFLVFICLIMTVCFMRPFFAVAKIDNAKKVRVGWYESAYCYTDKFGRKMGMAYEYQRKIEAYAGWDCEYVKGSWNELLEKLQKGEIDILSDVSYTDERAENILYPILPMGEESYYIYIKSDNNDMTMEDLNTFSGKKIGVYRDSIQEELVKKWAEDNRIYPEIVEMEAEAPKKAFHLLEVGEIDAFVIMDTYAGYESFSPVCKIGSSNYYFAISKKRPDLLSDINLAMSRIQYEDPYYNQKLYEKYILSVNSSAFLTKEERAWIKDHGPIRVGYRDNYLPFCDTDKETGELTGALKDYLDNASGSLLNDNLDFEAVPFPSVEDAIVAMQNGEVDCVFPVNLSLDESEKIDAILTDSLVESEVYTVVKNNASNDIYNNSDLKVAIVKGNTSFETFVMDYYPDCQVIFFDTIEACFEAVSEGTVDCMFVSSYRIYQTDKIRNRYKLALIATGKYVESAFVVPESEIQLYSILNKTVNLVGDEAVHSALSKYTYTEDRITFREYVRDNLIAVIVVVSATVIVILLLVIRQQKADKKAAEKQRLITATEFDHITGLYNRGFFYEYAAQMFNEHHECKYDAVVLNLDQFHTVNALYGWEFGDIVLNAIGDEIKLYLDETDGIACRSQADRFNIFCKSTEDYQPLFDRIQNRLDRVSGNVSVRLRMGVMHYQEGVAPVQLFDHARTACNMLRGGNHQRIMVFNDDLREKELRGQRLLSDLKRAIEEHEFLVYYQPKFDIISNPPKLCCAEALVRWKHSELGMISPVEFIPLFEENCKIGEVDRYVWREVARQIAYWRDKYGVVIPVSVNLSRLDVFDPDLEQVLHDLIEENGLRRSDLDLEVTESAYTDNSDKVIEIVSRLREKGHHIEMDDFGTGYSSLSMLSSMPVDILKLDRAFIKNMEHDKKDVRMVELILDIAKGLMVPVVAEGVETREQLDFLRARGCEIVQGFYFSPPVPASEFEEKFVTKEMLGDTDENKQLARIWYTNEEGYIEEAETDRQHQMSGEFARLLAENAELRKEADANRKIAELQQSVSALLKHMPAMTFSKDVNTRIYLACNQAFADYAHKETPEGVVGLTDFEIFDEETAQHFIEDDKKALSMDKPHIFFEDVPDAVGNPRRFQTTKLKFVDATGRECLLGLSQDVTDAMLIKQEYDEKLAHVSIQAHIDALTGIKNKNAYQEEEKRLNRMITELHHPEFAVTILDINELKKVNDTKGHKAGDEYIRRASRIICGIFKHSPVFRIGGDEFVVISQGEDYDNIDNLIGEIETHNEAALKENVLVIACGMARYNNEDSVAEVFEVADKKMYKNKKSLKKMTG